MQYWHVAPPGYRRGTTLHADRELRRLAGIGTPRTEDDEPSPETQNVLLFESRDDAEAHLERVGGVLVRVDLPDAPQEVEGYHKHWRRIPGEWVRPAGPIGKDAPDQPQAAA